MTVKNLSAKRRDDTDGNALVGLSSTVGAFATRIRQQLHEQETKDGQSQKAKEQRHALMLQAMTTIRKALQETRKVKLGTRFRFELDVCDWEGWPRLELNLIDTQALDKIEHGLIITANDRKDLGTVQMSTRALQVLGKIHLCDPTEFNRLPIVLKRAVRQFLDSLTSYVLSSTPLVKTEAEPRLAEPDGETDENDIISKKLREEGGFFQEEFNKNDNLIREEDIEANPATLSIPLGK